MGYPTMIPVNLFGFALNILCSIKLYVCGGVHPMHRLEGDVETSSILYLIILK